MTLSLTIQNADANLLNALKGVIKLSPKAHVTVKKKRRRRLLQRGKHSPT